MNADPRVYERDAERAVTVLGRGEAQADVVNRKKSLSLYQSEAHKMKSMFLTGASFHSDLREPSRINPIWSSFPVRCTQSIGSVAEMKQKLAYFTQSDEVMVVRYHQNNCMACNAVDKTFEFLCHEFARSMPKLHFYDINKDDLPELTKGLVRFPQIKAYSGGQWADLDFKPPQEFREKLYAEVEREVRRKSNEGHPVTALQAEEMYFSAAGPAMVLVMRENITKFYAKSQVRLHNYWKQVSVRRSWFFKKFLEPRVDEDLRNEWAAKSVFGEKVLFGPKALPSMESS